MPILVADPLPIELEALLEQRSLSGADRFDESHNVDEILIVDPQTSRIDWLALTGGEYKPLDHSRVIELGPAKLAERIEWPP